MYRKTFTTVLVFAILTFGVYSGLFAFRSLQQKRLAARQRVPGQAPTQIAGDKKSGSEPGNASSKSKDEDEKAMKPDPGKQTADAGRQSTGAEGRVVAKEGAKPAGDAGSGEPHASSATPANTESKAASQGPAAGDKRGTQEPDGANRTNHTFAAHPYSQMRQTIYDLLSGTERANSPKEAENRETKGPEAKGKSASVSESAQKDPKSAPTSYQAMREALSSLFPGEK